MHKPEPNSRCPRPRTTATGELECPKCGVTWDRTDEAPVCPRQQAAEAGLSQIRAILSAKSSTKR